MDTFPLYTLRAIESSDQPVHIYMASNNHINYDECALGCSPIPDKFQRDAPPHRFVDHVVNVRCWPHLRPRLTMNENCTGSHEADVRNQDDFPAVCEWVKDLLKPTVAEAEEAFGELHVGDSAASSSVTNAQ